MRPRGGAVQPGAILLAALLTLAASTLPPLALLLWEHLYSRREGQARKGRPGV